MLCGISLRKAYARIDETACRPFSPPTHVSANFDECRNNRFWFALCCLLCDTASESPLLYCQSPIIAWGDGGRPGSPKLVVRTSGHKLRNSFHGSGRGPDCLLVFSSLAVLLRTSCTVFLIAIGRVSEQSQVCSSGNLCTMHALRCDVFRKGTRILHSIVINTLFFADTISTHSYRCL